MVVVAAVPASVTTVAEFAYVVVVAVAAAAAVAMVAALLLLKVESSIKFNISVQTNKGIDNLP